MQLAYSLYHELGFKGLAFQLNSIGCPRCRPAYIETLRAYFRPHQAGLPEVDRRRLEVNPLRVLDTKEAATLRLLDAAPRSIDHLCLACADHFRALTGYLDLLGLPYVINPRLVRGFDYYVRTVFEVWGSELGAQNALCGGGRYDGLVESVGGPPTPGVGVGIGIERIVISLRRQGIEPPPLTQPQVIVLHHGPAAKAEAIRLVDELRRQGVPTLMAFGDRSLKAQLKTADRSGARFALLLGEEELAGATVTVRDLQTGTQTAVPRHDLLRWLRHHQPATA
jgi:histidyl-tRNA synthetase